MDEFLSESEQWERLKDWLKQNVPWLLTGVAVAVIGVVGWRWWQAREETQLLAAASRYDVLVKAFDRRDLAAVTTEADALARDHGGTGYADQGQLAAARLLLEEKQPDQALVRLQKLVADTSDPELALIARLRIARIQLDQKQPDAALATLSAVDAGAFAPRYAETRGDALLAKGDRDGALKAYREAQAAGTAVVDADLLSLKINDLTRS